MTFDPARRQVFVIGNEAADADSLVSAYALARLLDSPEAPWVSSLDLAMQFAFPLGRSKVRLLVAMQFR